MCYDKNIAMPLYSNATNVNRRVTSGGKKTYTHTHTPSQLEQLSHTKYLIQKQPTLFYAFFSRV